MLSSMGRTRFAEATPGYTSLFRTCLHSFAGHGLQDLARAGSSLAVILKAGQWRSAAFARYMEEADLERDVAVELVIGSDGEEFLD